MTDNKDDNLEFLRNRDVTLTCTCRAVYKNRLEFLKHFQQHDNKQIDKIVENIVENIESNNLIKNN